ncbi:MAG: IS3 family transposase [Blastocatellia bacterium]|nr:IS3 family transposase [Blastocatellia bacterium]
MSRSGYYAYRQRQTQPPTVDKVELAQKVRSCFLAHRRRDGARRLRAELKTQGLAIGRYRVRTLMRSLG